MEHSRAQRQKFTIHIVTRVNWLDIRMAIAPRLPPEQVTHRAYDSPHTATLLFRVLTSLKLGTGPALMSDSTHPQRPHTTVILAMSADGKIADVARSPARFGSAQDKAHLERQIAQADGVLFGAGTLRAYGTTLSISTPALQQQRQQQGKPIQPIQIVCSASATLDPQWRFFEQPVPRWLLTTPEAAHPWQARPEFAQVWTADVTSEGIVWPPVLHQWYQAGIHHLAVLGGSELVAALFAQDCIDELWLTVCPLVLGGPAPTPVAGSGWPEALAPRLQLLSVHTEGEEVFLHYRLRHQKNCTTLEGLDGGQS